MRAGRRQQGAGKRQTGEKDPQATKLSFLLKSEKKKRKNNHSYLFLVRHGTGLSVQRLMPGVARDALAMTT